MYNIGTVNEKNQFRICTMFQDVLDAFSFYNIFVHLKIFWWLKVKKAFSEIHIMIFGQM